MENVRPQSLHIPATDGYGLGAHCWRHAPGDSARPVVIINPATSVHSRYYARFAAFLYGHGFDVLTYDYRGIGYSKPPSLRGFQASWLDWGRKDFEGVLQYVAVAFPGQPVQVVAHSVGGFLVGLAPSNGGVSRVFTMGAQFAYWPDYAAHKRAGMYLKWHIVMPALAALLGYFPGQRLGWLEDTPRGVVQDWTAPHPRFEDAYRRGSRAMGEEGRQALVAGFSRLQGPLLALSATDDEYGTVAAIQRLLGYFDQASRRHLQVAPEHIGVDAIGHFAFFHARFAETLWPIPLHWLRHSQLAEGSPGVLMPPFAG